MPTVVDHLDTAKILQERRDFDYSKRIIELDPARSADAAPLTVLLKKLDKTTVDTAEFRWLEGYRNPRWVKFSGSDESSPGTTLALGTDEGKLVRENELLKVPRTGEVMLVRTINGDNITVVRGYGTTAPTPLRQNEPLLILATAYQENSVPGRMKITQPVKVYNYVQIIKTPITISGTAAAEKQVAEPRERLRLQRKASVEHLLDIEYAIWFGEPKEDLSAGPDGPQRSTGGVLYFAKDNILDVKSENGGALTYELFEQWLEEAMRYGSKTKWLFASSRLLTVFDILAEKKLQVERGEDTYGVAIRRWVSNHGSINIVHHPLFEGEEYGHMGVLIDLDVEDLGLVHLPGRDTRLRLNVGEPARDGYLDVYETDVGLRFPLSKCHGVITGVETAA